MIATPYHDQADSHDATFVNLVFPVIGKVIPFDHRYLLYAAINTTLEKRTGEPWLRRARAGLIAVRGAYGGGLLHLERGASFTLRLSADEIGQVLPLAGQSLRLGGHSIHVGAPRVLPVAPSETLRSDLVTTKNGQDEARFDGEVRRQLDRIGIRASFVRGKRRFLTIRGRKIIGHELTLRDLSEEDSLRLQIRGLGGRRRMGCGVFTPVRRI